MATELQFFKDLDLSLTPHPLTGDISPKYNADAIRRALKHLFLLEKWDVPFNSDIYGYGYEMLFSIPTSLAKISIKDKIKWIVSSFEPRIELEDVKVEVSKDETQVEITVSYHINSLRVGDSTSFTIQRVR